MLTLLSEIHMCQLVLKRKPKRTGYLTIPPLAMLVLHLVLSSWPVALDLYGFLLMAQTLIFQCFATVYVLLLLFKESESLKKEREELERQPQMVYAISSAFVSETGT